MRILPVSEIVRVTGAVAQGLRKSEAWVPALGQASIDSVPVVVERLDKSGVSYLIFTARTGANVTGRIAMSGQTGAFLEVQGIERSGDALPAFVDPVEVLRDRARRIPGEYAELALAMAGRHPAYVWKPCRESMSRFLPFSLFTIRDRLLYVRVDGKMFSRLTTVGRG